MKRYITLLFVLFTCLQMSLPSLAQNRSNTFYIYRNDGDFNAIFYNTVDSMVYSKLDTDSIEQEYYVTQEIWTPDTVYRIPLSAIDSISYVVPQTIFQEGVTELTKHFENYVIAVEGQTLFLKTDIPQQLLPKVGDKLVSVSVNDVFPNGFRGIVKTVKTETGAMVVDCDRLAIEEAFIQYFSSMNSAVYSNDDDQSQQVRKAINGDLVHYDQTKVFTPFILPLPENTLGISNDKEVDNVTKGTELSFSNQLTITMKPTLRIQSSFIIFPDGEIDLSLSIKNQLITDVKFDVAGNLKFSKSLQVGPGVEIPLGGGANFYAEFGIGLSVEGSVAFSGTLETESDDYFFVKYNNKYTKGNTIKAVSNRDILPRLKETNAAFGKLTGFAYAYLEGGVDYGSKNIGKLGLRAEVGPVLELTAPLDLPFHLPLERNTENYFELKDQSAVSLAIKVGASMELALLNGLAGLSVPLWEWKSQPLIDWRFVPTFSEPSFQADKESKEKWLSYNVADDVIIPLEVGAVVFDLDNEKLYYKLTYKDAKYRNTKSFTDYSVAFNQLSINHHYAAYPYLYWFGQVILGEPTQEFGLAITAITDETGEVDASSAVLAAHLEGDTDFVEDNWKVGFVYGEDPQLADGTTIWLTPNANNQFRHKLLSLTGGTTYYYKAFILIDGENVDGEIKSFITPLPVELPRLSVTSATYYPNHYTYNGNLYSFKYNCTTYAKLTNDRNIEDWGYEYLDADGNATKVSLSEYNRSSIADPRYAYYLNESSGTVKLRGFVKFQGDKVYRYAEPTDFPVAYPESSSLTLTNCTFLGTETNVTSDNGTPWKYKSSFRFEFTATGAYWLKVGTQEISDGTATGGWATWNNDLEHIMVECVDGENATTVNYYYDDKAFEGEYKVKLIGIDTTHGTECKTDGYVTYTYNNNHFTGCTFHPATNAKPTWTTSGSRAELPYKTVINVYE